MQQEAIRANNQITKVAQILFVDLVIAIVNATKGNAINNIPIYILITFSYKTALALPGLCIASCAVLSPSSYLFSTAPNSFPVVILCKLPNQYWIYDSKEPSTRTRTVLTKCELHCYEVPNAGNHFPPPGTIGSANCFVADVLIIGVASTIFAKSGCLGS